MTAVSSFMDLRARHALLILLAVVALRTQPRRALAGRRA